MSNIDNRSNNDNSNHLRWSNIDKDIFMIKKKVHEGSYSMPSPHSHYYHELYYIASGNCNLLVEDKYYSLKSGHIIIIPANVLHRTEYNEDVTTVCYSINFTDKHIKDFYDELGTAWVLSHLMGVLFRIPESNTYEFDKILEVIENDYDANTDLCTIANKNLFNYLLVRLFKYAKPVKLMTVVKENNINALDDDMQLAVKYIVDHYMEPVKLDDVAHILGLNPSYFSTKFKNSTGIKFSDYLCHIRVTHAEGLLQTTEKSLQEIAYECGFINSNYFGDTFKKINNISPKAYRKAHKSDR